MTRNQWLYFPSEGGHTQDFYALKKSVDPGRVWMREPLCIEYFDLLIFLCIEYFDLLIFMYIKYFDLLTFLNFEYFDFWQKYFDLWIYLWAALWHKGFDPWLPPLGSWVRVLVTPCGFRSGWNKIWVVFSLGFSCFPLPQISSHSFCLISFHQLLWWCNRHDRPASLLFTDF